MHAEGLLKRDMGWQASDIKANPILAVNVPRQLPNEIMNFDIGEEGESCFHGLLSLSRATRCSANHLAKIFRRLWFIDQNRFDIAIFKRLYHRARQQRGQLLLTGMRARTRVPWPGSLLMLKPPPNRIARSRIERKPRWPG